MQETIDNLDEKLKNLTREQEAQTELMAEIKTKFLSRAAEKTMAYYFSKIALGLQRDCGEKAPHDVKKQMQDSNFEELF